MAMKKETDFTKEPVDVLYLLLQPQGTEVVDNRVARLRTMDTYKLKEALEQRMKIKGLPFEENPVLPEFNRG